jgi:peptidylprolyl isomerase
MCYLARQKRFAMKTHASPGDQVSVHYTGRFTDGQVFDSSRGRDEPLAFTIGAGQMIPGFEKAVLGMAPGESKTVTLAPEDAYGQPNPNYVLKFAKTDLPTDLNPAVGDQLMLTLKDGGQFPVTITQLTADTVTLDGNHQMAGKTLVFDIQLVDIG